MTNYSIYKNKYYKYKNDVKFGGKSDTLITKELKNNNTHLKYKIFDYKDDYPNPEKELLRMKVITKINEKIPELDIIDIFLYGYADNKNSLDPVLCTDLNKYINNTEKSDKIDKIIKINLKIIDKIENKSFTINKNIKNNLVFLNYNNNEVIINLKSYNRIKDQQIIKTKYDFDCIIWCLLYRYTNLKLLYGFSGSILPEQYNKINKQYNCDVECFGGFINHTLKYYFGLFYDLEKYFGCLGNFFNCELIKGFYVANPPFAVEFINNTINKINKNFEINKISLLLVIPSWDISDRIILNNICKKKLKIDYKNDIISKSLKDKSYCKNYCLYCKENFPYYDFVKDVNINYAASNLIILSSDNTNFNLDIFPKYNYQIKLNN